MTPDGVEMAMSQFLRAATGRDVDAIRLRPKALASALLQIQHFPTDTSNTVVTCGASPRARSVWRRLPVHYELVLVVDETMNLAGELVKSLGDLVREEHRRANDRDRRSVIEANGVWAPGYPPHLLLSSRHVSPIFEKRVKLEDRYVSLFSAVPIDDTELRAYDRSRADLVSSLTVEGMLKYPRTT